MKVLYYTLILAHFLSGFAHSSFKSFSDEYIESINSQNLTWKARRYFHKDTTALQIRNKLGAKPGEARSNLKVVSYDVTKDIPEHFDAREKWTKCRSLKEIRDQANCGSCWAFAATEAMTDRICIHSNSTKQISVSAQDLLSCCTGCGEGCNGGEPSDAWKYWHTTGIVSGGLYKSSNGCRSYSLAPCDHHVNGTLTNCSSIPDAATPKCEKTCDAGTNLTYSSELTYGQEPYRIAENVTSIQWEIMTNGPVEAEFDVYEDFLVYSEGVYQKTKNVTKVGAHDVKIIGWGVEKNISYWLIANSWNTEWGEKGYFKMIRGENNCGIESYIMAGLPKLKNSSAAVRIETMSIILSLILYILQHFYWFVKW